MAQVNMQALKLVLYNRSNTNVLSKFSSVSQELRLAAAEVVRQNFEELLIAALIRLSWLCSASAPVEWLCKTAGPAVVGSPDVTRTVLLEVGNTDARAANILARHGLQLTDAVLHAAAQQHVGGLGVLAQSVLRQQQAQHPGSIELAGVSPPLQMALLMTGAELTVAVKHLVAGELQPDQLSTVLLLLCNRRQKLQEPFTTLLTAFKEANSASTADGAQGGSCASEQWWRLMQTCAARGHAAYIQQLVDAMPPAVVQPKGLLSAARLLDTVVQSGLKHSASNEHYQVTKAVLTTLQPVPAVQQIPVEIYIGMLQGSTSMAFLLTALLQLPQAQLVTPSMTVTLLTRTAKHDRPLLLEGLLSLPAVQQLGQQHVKSLVRALLLVGVDVAAKVRPSFSILHPLAAKLTADSLLELVTEAVQCRHASAFAILLQISPAAHQLVSHPGLIDVLCTAIRNGIFPQSAHNSLHSMPGSQQWDKSAVYRVMRCLLQCGHAVDAFWQYGECKIPAMLQLTAQQVGALLQVSLNSGCCGSISSLCGLPGADALQPQLVAGLCRALVMTYPCNWSSDSSYAALKSLLALTAAQRIDATTAGQLLSAALRAGQALMAVLLQQQLPQLQDAAAAAEGASMLLQQPLLQRVGQAFKAGALAVAQQLHRLTRQQDSSDDSSSSSVHPLLQQLQKAFRSRQMEVVQHLCQLRELSHVPAADRGALLVEAVYAIRGHSAPHDSLWERAWDKENTLLQVIPALLPPEQCTPAILAQLLQSSSAAGCTRVLLQLIEQYPSAQQLSAAELEPLLLQSMAWESSETIHVDDERGRVLLALLRLPGAQKVSGDAIRKLVAALAASRSGCSVDEVLELPAARTMSAAAVCDAVEVCLQCSYAHLYMQACFKRLMQIGSGAGLCAEQLHQLLLCALQQQQYWALEELLKRHAAPADGVLVGWAHECVEAGRRRHRSTQDMHKVLYGRF